MNKNRCGGEDFRLTPREKEVLQLLVKGYTNKEIAEEFCFSIHTAKAHVSAIIKKFKVKKRLEAVLIAVNSKKVNAETINLHQD